MDTHHPPHLYLDHTWYFITAATVGHAPFFADDQARVVFRENLRSLAQRREVGLRAWVVLSDHYHLLLRTERGRDLGVFCGQLHGATARWVNSREAAAGRQVWDNYWDACVRSEVDLWTRVNYAHQNPVKHGYVQHPEDWAFSSYRYYLRTKGEEWVRECWERYPVIDFLEDDGRFRSGTPVGG